jgi:ketosteroid isomerase-like protein
MPLSRRFVLLVLAAASSLLICPLPAGAADFDDPKQAFYIARPSLGSLGADEARQANAVRLAYLEYFNNDINEIEGMLAEGASWRMLGPGGYELFKEYSEKNVRDWFNELAASFRYDYMHIGEFIVQGNKVIAFGSEHGYGRASKREFNNNWIHVWTFHEEKVVSFRAYADTDTLIWTLQTR